MTYPESDRNTALLLLASFEQKLLPGALRRIGIWKSIAPGLLREWREDVAQELAIDCLEHASAIIALGERDRHARWMRLCETTIYRHWRHRQAVPDTVEEPAAPEWQGRQPPTVHLPPLVTLGNGRPNLVASIKKNGHARRDLRQMLDALLADLGWDDDCYAFWQARVVEALTGLAADLLLEQDAIASAHDLAAPNPELRRRRLRRLVKRFPVQPSTLPIRSALGPWRRTPRLREGTPRQMLEQATVFGPNTAASWLWLFEACCHERDAAAALRAVWRARRCRGVARTAIVLARARVWELRGELSRAVGLLRRALARWPRAPALRHALRCVTAMR